MLFAIHSLDHADAAALRESRRAAHADYMRQHAAQIVFGGPLLAADQTTRIGMLVVIDAASPQAALDFMRAEPYHQAGVFAHTTTLPYALVVHRVPTP